MNIIVKDFSIRGRHFTIVKHDKLYCAIEDKYITDGKINRQLWGPQLHPGETLEDCINSVTDAVEVDYLVEQGHTRAEAFAIYWDMMDNLVMIKELLGEQ